MAERLSCANALGTPAATAGPLQTHGIQPARADLALTTGRTYLIEVDERDNDARVQILDAQNAVLAQADHPERRSGTRRLVIAVPDSAAVTVQVIGNEHPNVTGTAAVRAYDLVGLQARPDCAAAYKSLAAADSDYASGKDISRGRAVSSGQSARAQYLKAAEGYSAALHALPPENRMLRGGAALAVAGVEYYDLQDWIKTTDSARMAAEMLANVDPYRHARAQSLLAYAWLEIGQSATPNSAAADAGVRPAELLGRARTTLVGLRRFYQQHGAHYDAALQVTNIALTWYYEGRYDQCVPAATTASVMFGSLQETERRAQALRNRALCLWGLGRLTEALAWFERTLAETDPEPFPVIYMGALTNTALADYALGRFDESLRLYDRALAFAQRGQFARDEAYCLYGIGVNYYALGDRERAREFLERSLAIRTVALDGRGRMVTLRALATIAADQGELDRALGADREALALAVAPTAVARIRIQHAAHTALAGRPQEAKTELDEVIASSGRAEPVVQAEAYLQRGILLRGTGKPEEALADLAIARSRLHRFGGVTEEFEANIELARSLRLLGQTSAALAADERALALADAVRLQTINPELRLQLQLPLRAAYDLKVELLRARYEDALAAADKGEADRVARLAFATADASRAHTLADVAVQQYTAAARRVLAPELRRRDELYQHLSAMRFALDSRLERSGSDDARARRLITDIAEVERQVDTVNTAIAATLASAAIRPADTGKAVGLPHLPADTVLVSYWLGSESAYAWTVSLGSIHWVRLPPSTAINQQAIAFYQSLSRLIDIPLARRLSDAQALYEMILRPIEPQVTAARQWIVIPDGALDYVPFPALRAGDSRGSEFVALQHDVALTPAAWRLESGAARPAALGRRALLLVADPVYQSDDPRLHPLAGESSALPAPLPRGADPGSRRYTRLPFTAAEAAGIESQFASGDIDVLLGVDATRQRLLALDWSRYRFIHIATHGVVDAQVPQLSALILGAYDADGNTVDGAVRVADLSMQTLNADVAVFSACDTALGKEVPSEGLVGISSTVLARGARAVVASLWPVSDEIGARLMTEFYRHLLRDSMTAPAALGAAMRSAVSHDESADPALWAAFQVSVVALGPELPGRNTAAMSSP